MYYRAEKTQIWVSKAVLIGVIPQGELSFKKLDYYNNMKHNKINTINTTWYQHIKECGIQDQISFFFVKQLFNDSFLKAKSKIKFRRTFQVSFCQCTWNRL